MPSLKYNYALFLGVALSGLVLGVSCTSLFTGVTSPSDCGKEIVEDVTPKTRLKKVSNTVGNSDPVIRQTFNPVADSSPVKEYPSESIQRSPTGIENLVGDRSKPVPVDPAKPMAGLQQPTTKEMTTPVSVPIVSLTKVPPTPDPNPPVKVAVNSGSSVENMVKNPEKMPTTIAPNRPEAPKPVESQKVADKESPRKEPVTVSENNVVRIVEAQGNDVIVTSFDAVIIIKGRCGKLTVAGGKNRIQCDMVREIEVIGNGNTLNLTQVEKGMVVGNSNEISWKQLINGNEPKLISTGVDNKLLRTP